MGENKGRLKNKSVIDRMLSTKDGAVLFNELVDKFYESIDKQDTYFSQAKIFDEELKAVHDKVLNALEKRWFNDFIEDYRIDHEEMLIELKSVADSIKMLHGIALYESIDKLFDMLNNIHRDRKFDSLACQGGVGNLLRSISHFYVGCTVLGFTNSDTLDSAWLTLRCAIDLINLKDCVLLNEICDVILVLKSFKDSDSFKGYYTYCIDKSNMKHGLNIQIIE